MKKIIILNGSPRKNGRTSELVKAFTKGAKESGNEIREFYLQGMDIRGCLGCNACKNRLPAADPCVQKDDMTEIYEAFQWADIVVFASPVFWFTITGTLKTAVDRLYALTHPFGHAGFKKDSVLLMTAGAPVYDQPLEWYAGFKKYMEWHSLGEMLGAGKTEEARQLGAGIH